MEPKMEVGDKVKLNVNWWKLWYMAEYGRKPPVVPSGTTVYTIQKTHVDHKMQHRANIIDRGTKEQPGTNQTFWTPVKYLTPVNSE